MRHTSYRTTIFRDGASVIEEFCMKEGLQWPCDAELRDREIEHLRAALDDEKERNGLYLATLDNMNADNGLAALAAALPEALTYSDDYPYDLNAVGTATNLLGERGVFWPTGLNEYRELIHQYQAEIATLRAALELAHDHHSFGPSDCTPANCSAEAVLATFRPHPDRRTEW